MHQEVVHMESRWKISAKRLDHFQALLEALDAGLERTASVLCLAEGGTIEVDPNFLGRTYIPAMLAYNSDILGLHQNLVVSLGSC